MEGVGLRGMKNAVSDDEDAVVGEEGVYGDVDMWEKEQDEEMIKTMKMGRGRKGDDGPTEVLALSGTDSDSDLELPTIKKLRKKERNKVRQEKEELDDEEGDLSESDLGSEQEEEEDVRRWGNKKKYYYGGNTGEELEHELGDSDLEEDKIEELEAAILQSRQLEMMDEEDFLDAFVAKKSESNEKKAEPSDNLARDLSKLSRKEQVKLFKQQSPEFAGVVADFQLRMGDAVKLAKVTALAEGGALPDGPVLDYIRNKLELLLNYCTNILAYLMFKSRGVTMALHPVTGRLVQYRQLIDKLEDMDKVVMPQVEEVIKRKENGESVKQMVKEERRKARRELERKKQKPFIFSTKSESVEDTKSKKKRKNKRKAEAVGLSGLEGLTGDEKMAVELYQAIKKSKNNEDLQDDDDLEDIALNPREDEKEDNDEENIDNNTYNDTNDLEEEEEAEKRAITYKIAKNKGLMPKRSKLQRNPRVKNRMKFEKAKKRRKGAVREMRDQSQKYSGEASGLNARVKKGVKIK